MPGHVAASIENLRSTIASLERKLQQLKRELAALESEELRPTVSLVSSERPERDRKLARNQSIRHWNPRLEFDVEEYKRYGRQMIIPGFGLQGQLLLKNARVLIVGVGGLGCPAAAYLAGAGIGKIGLIDGDTVEISNLHRQIIHSSSKIGQTKVESAVEYLRQLNPIPRYVQYPFNLSSANALEIFDAYDIILDCTDQPQSRYLVSDAAVLSKKLLITASATITQGQLMTFRNHLYGQPCYRCVFPKPPSPETVQSCSDSGILGPAVGVMGVLMASEIIKMLIQCAVYRENERLSWKSPTGSSTLLLYSAYDETPFRTSFLRWKSRKNCPACSECPSITRESLTSGSLDYAVFCGFSEPVKILPDQYRYPADAFHELVRRDWYLLEEGKGRDDYPSFPNGGRYYILVDVREKQDFDMCHIDGSLNLPYSVIDRAIREPGWLAKELDKNRASNRIWQVEKQLNRQDLTDCFFICRYGNDSQKAVDFFVNNMDKEFGCFNFHKYDESEYKPVLDGDGRRVVSYPQFGHIGDIEGGLRAWSKVDPTFPEY